MFLENRLVKVEQGYLKGIPAGNPAYTIFKGVPFAKAPIGERRWMAPEKIERWEGIRKCDEYAPAAIQYPGMMYHAEFKPAEVDESEDCLYMNIWTPNLSPKKKLPVMFWIHGGAFTNGYCYEMEFDGEVFCKREVILVTVPYRLAALGFFAHPELTARSEEHSSGNYGVLDLIEALKWVKTNISAFGGDPHNITIFGQSAGGAMVQVLSTSPLTKGLFQHAIVQSGGGINSLGCGTSLKEAEEMGVQLCEATGYTISELMKLDGKTINKLLLAASEKLKPKSVYFSPVVDGYVLSKAPGECIAENIHHDVDYMTGSVSGDGSIFNHCPAQTKEQFKAFIKAKYGVFAAQWEALFAKEMDMGEGIAARKYENDSAPMVPLAWAKAEQKNGRKPLYVYYFDRKMPGDNRGAFHSSELWYVFGTLNRCWRTLEEGFTPWDYALSDRMIDYWTNFAKTGNPNMGGRIVPTWTPYTTDCPLVMRFNETMPGMKDFDEDSLTNGMADLMVEEIVR